MHSVDRLADTDERRLVVAAVRIALGSDDRRTLHDLLAAPLDWSRVIAEAWGNKVLPLVAKTLDSEADRVPRADLTELRRRREVVARRNLRFAGELVRLVRRLREEGIRALPLKGPLLAKRLYGDLGLRQFSDLDILAPPAEHPPALAVAQCCGYRVISPAVPMTTAQRAAQIRFGIGYHVELQHSHTGIRLELHWGPLPGEFGFPATRFWQGLETVELAGSRLPDLADEGLLRYLCLHGTKDRWERLSLVADLAAALRRYPDVDWERLLAEATQAGHRRALLLGPMVAHRLLGSPLPPALATLIREEDRALSGAARLCRPFRAQTRWRRLRYRVRLRRGPIAKLDQLFRDLVAPTVAEIEAVRLPARGFLLYYLLRPALLLAKFLRPRRERPEA